MALAAAAGDDVPPVAIAVTPEPPREDRWSQAERFTLGGLLVFAAVLFVFTMLDHYVF